VVKKIQFIIILQKSLQPYSTLQIVILNMTAKNAQYIKLLYEIYIYMTKM